MDTDTSLPGSPAGGPLQAVTPDRVNQQRESIAFASFKAEGRGSSVHEKISQFNSMVSQSKQLERKTADAALKRAMVGREEAEAEMRRYREEAKMLRKAIDEGKERERRVGERLETVMESYGRAKETHAHTQALWEKEIRRARKETFKTQSSTVKIQEELKSARSSVKALEENLNREKERSRIREQEAFTARYQIVGVQEQLDDALERIKLVEQERDAFKTAAKNEEVARIAAEGRIPLPKTEGPDDEFGSPVKKSKKNKTSGDSRVSLSTMEILSSAASEMEIEELGMQAQWEKQRADRALEMIEFLQAECQMHCCPCSKSKHRASLGMSQLPQEQQELVHEQQPVGPEEAELDDAEPEEITTIRLEEAPAGDIEMEPSPVEEDLATLAPPQSKKELRRSTIFCPQEGTFRTVSEQEAEILEAQKEVMSKMEVHSEAEAEADPPSPIEVEKNPRSYARTPSVEPPAFALMAQERTSLLSLLDAPHGGPHSAPLPSMRSVPTVSSVEATGEESEQPRASPETRPHTSATVYNVTTTRVPIRDETREPSLSFSEKLRTPSSSSSNASFDHTDPALTPTMTREQALAKIRERRGRARSIAQERVVSNKRTAQSAERREMSAPTRKKSRS